MVCWTPPQRDGLTREGHEDLCILTLSGVADGKLVGGRVRIRLRRTAQFLLRARIICAGLRLEHARNAWGRITHADSTLRNFFSGIASMAGKPGLVSASWQFRSFLASCSADSSVDCTPSEAAKRFDGRLICVHHVSLYCWKLHACTKQSNTISTGGGEARTDSTTGALRFCGLHTPHLTLPTGQFRSAGTEARPTSEAMKAAAPTTVGATGAGSRGIIRSRPSRQRHTQTCQTGLGFVVCSIVARLRQPSRRQLREHFECRCDSPFNIPCTVVCSAVT
jgi:hypothetical protein